MPVNSSLIASNDTGDKWKVRLKVHSKSDPELCWIHCMVLYKPIAKTKFVSILSRAGTKQFIYCVYEIHLLQQIQ